MVFTDRGVNPQKDISIFTHLPLWADTSKLTNSMLSEFFSLDRLDRIR